MAPLTAGHGELLFENVDGRTVALTAAAASPLRLLQPKNHGDAAWVYTSTYGGGLVGGDECRLNLKVGRNAKAVLLTQASTKVYRSPLPARQVLTAEIQAGGWLVQAPDPLACFADSSFEQEQEFALDTAANLALVDWVTAGRRAMGERWAARKYASRIRIQRAGHTELFESLRLAGPQRMASLGRFNSLALLVLTGPELKNAAQQIREQIEAMQVRRLMELVCTASPLGNQGVLVRIASISPEDTGKVLREYLQLLTPQLGDDPWARKW